MTAVPPVGSAPTGDHPVDEVLALSLEGAATAEDGTPDPGEGLLGPGELAAVEQHLAGCGSCRARRADLAEVPGLLRRLDADSHRPDSLMPDDVAARLDRALREASTDTAADKSPAATPVPPDQGAAERSRPAPADVVPLRRPRRPRSTVLLSAAAALAAVGLVGGVLWGAVSGSGGSAGSTASAGGVSGPAALPSADSAAGSAADAAPVLVPTTLDLDATTLADGVRATLRTPPTAAVPLPTSTTGAPAPAAAGAGPLAALLTPAGLRTCVQRLAPGQPLREVLAVRWQGDPAAVLVFGTPGDPGHLDAYAVVPACPVGDFLGFVRLPA
ncbi:MAG TPA: zf-HC2 domain-containing protein [Motilibacteraceae bacterium]|nr:zf-HC2 domain-containing protein [Motilibacteraceae bacterium]